MLPLSASDSQVIRVEGDPPTHGGLLECRISIELQTMDRESLGTWTGEFERRVESQSAPSTINNIVNVTGGVISAAQGLINNSPGQSMRHEAVDPAFEIVQLKRAAGIRVTTRVQLSSLSGGADLHLHATMPFVIGRATDNSAHLVVDGQLTLVSRRHCQLEFDDDGGIDLVHLSTVNPTRLDGGDIGRRTPIPTDRTSTIQLGQDEGGTHPSMFLCTVVPIPCQGLSTQVSRHLIDHGEMPTTSDTTGSLAGLLLCVREHGSPRIIAEHLLVFSAIRLSDVPRLVCPSEVTLIDSLPTGRTRGERIGFFRCPQGGIRTANLDEESGGIYMSGSPTPSQRIGEYRVV